MVKRILCYVHDTTRFALSFNTSSDLLLHGFNEFIGLIMLMVTNLWVLILSIMAMTLSFRSPVSNNNYSIFFEV
jgi:hypothetical protein